MCRPSVARLIVRKREGRQTLPPTNLELVDGDRVSPSAHPSNQRIDRFDLWGQCSDNLEWYGVSSASAGQAAYRHGRRSPNVQGPGGIAN